MRADFSRAQKLKSKRAEIRGVVTRGRARGKRSGKGRGGEKERRKGERERERRWMRRWPTYCKEWWYLLPGLAHCWGLGTLSIGT